MKKLMFKVAKYVDKILDKKKLIILYTSSAQPHVRFSSPDGSMFVEASTSRPKPLKITIEEII